MRKRGNNRGGLITDLALIPIFVASAVTGLGLYFAGFDTPHEVWEKWALAHVVASALFLGFGIYHICNHWPWYKSLFSNGLGAKSPTTALLSVAFPIIAITGLVLLFVIEGPNSAVGSIHFWLAVALIALSVWHIVKRWKALMKMLKNSDI